MQPGSIVYFGTNGPHSGHHADIVFGSFDGFEERCVLAVKCDSFTESQHIFELCTKANFFVYRDIEGTYFGCLKSPDDMRPGSITLAFAYGRHADADEMIEIIKQHPYLRHRFMAVCEKHGWDNIFE